MQEGKDPLGWIGYVDGSDTYLTTESWDVAVRAAGAWSRAVDAALGIEETGVFHTGCALGPMSNEGESRPPSPIGMALTRPPGHHAAHSLSNGFCVFNFAMAAAVHALWRNPKLKISILDWDVHFGQGLMDILDKCGEDRLDDENEGDGSVLGTDRDWTSQIRYVSLHQVPCFPYEGQTRKIRGRHRNVLTIPISPDSTWHCGYRESFARYALPFVRSSESGEMGGPWEPDLVLVCAGYDALDSDELASVNLVAEDFGEMTRMLRDRIGHSFGGDGSGKKKPALVFGLEGGYQLRDGVAGGNLSDALMETLKALW